MDLYANQPIKHNGKSYDIGDTLEKVNKEDAERLISLRAASSMPGRESSEEANEPNDPVENVENNESKDLKQELSELDFSDLKQAATDHGIEFNANIGEEKLIDRIISEEKAEAVLAEFEEAEEVEEVEAESADGES
ncbi:hypothetical protein [Salibacterium halotolerans]|uniref:DUF7210 domain-containing protein n=1 Tax=Salibacterium halotolerans TaxID=1884432 RepID=A0A1I5MMY0_9BACI|nr:hypothetical protein [Salibacterium halotolerans]SFP10974.1 hypothetical protein SAMN05518683_102287 [Salibacterium halotolerans]